MSTAATLLRWLMPFRWRVALAIALGAITIACNIGLLGMAAYLISDAALRPLLVALTLPIYLVRFAGVARAGSRYAERLIGHDVTFRLLARVRTQVFRQLTRFTLGELLAFHSGDLLTRLLADIDELQHLYLRVVGPVLVAGAIVVLTSGVFALFSPLLAWTALIALGLTGICIPLLAEWLGRRLGAEQPAARALLHVQLADGIQGVHDILAFGQEHAYQERVRTQDDVLVGLQRRLARVSGMEQALNTLAQSLALWMVVVIAIPLVERRHIGGVYLAFLPLVMLASFEAIEPLAPALQSLSRVLAAGRRVLALLEDVPSVEDADGSLAAPDDVARGAAPVLLRECQPALEFEHVSFVYARNGRAVLSDVSFSVPVGGRVAIVGPSGAGKSTIARLALRCANPSGGTIRLGGEDVRLLTASDVRATVGLVAQDEHLFSTTVRANLLLARPDATDSDLIRALAQAQLSELLSQLPDGLDTWIGEHGYRLSGGERQRIVLARALLREASVLLLDEPTANLDAITERAVLDAFEPVMRRCTTVLITHRLCRMERMDQILVLDAGRIVERGTHAALLARGGRYWRMIETQNSVFDMLASDVAQTRVGEGLRDG